MAYNEDIGALLNQRQAFARARYPSDDASMDYDDSPSLYSYADNALHTESDMCHSPVKTTNDACESPDISQGLGTLGPNLRLMSPPPWADDADDAKSITSFSSKKGAKGEGRQKNKTFIGLGLGGLPSLGRSSVDRQPSNGYNYSPSASTSTTTITSTPVIPSSTKSKTPFITFPGGRSRSRTIGSSTMSEVNSTSSSSHATPQLTRLDTQFSATTNIGPPSANTLKSDWSNDRSPSPGDDFNLTEPRSSCILPEEALSLSTDRRRDKANIHPFANPDLHSPSIPAFSHGYQPSPSLSPTTTPEYDSYVLASHNIGTSKVTDGPRRQIRKTPPPPLTLEAPAVHPSRVSQADTSSLEDAWSMIPERTSAVYQPSQTSVVDLGMSTAPGADDHPSAKSIRPGTTPGPEGDQSTNIRGVPRKPAPLAPQALSTPSNNLQLDSLPSPTPSQPRLPLRHASRPLDVRSISSPVAPPTPTPTPAGVPQGMLSFPGSAFYNLISLEEAQANAKTRSASQARAANAVDDSYPEARNRSKSTSTTTGASINTFQGNSSTISVLSSKDSSTTPVVSKRTRTKTDTSVFGGLIGRSGGTSGAKGFSEADSHLEGSQRDHKSVMHPVPILKHKKSSGILKFWKDSSNPPASLSFPSNEKPIPAQNTSSLPHEVIEPRHTQNGTGERRIRKELASDSHRSRAPSILGQTDDTPHVGMSEKPLPGTDRSLLSDRPNPSSPKQDFLTLRPVSMAFSFLPPDFLAKDSPQLPSGSLECPVPPLPTSAYTSQHHTSHRKDSYCHSALISPASTSFNSMNSLPTSSSSFTTSSSSGSYSPLPTPSSIAHTSPRYYQKGRDSSEDQTALIISLANQVRELEEEVRRLKAESLIGVRCSRCDEGVYMNAIGGDSIGLKDDGMVNRPRARTGTGTRFGSNI